MFPTILSTPASLTRSSFRVPLNFSFSNVAHSLHLFIVPPDHTTMSMTQSASTQNQTQNLDIEGQRPSAPEPTQTHTPWSAPPLRMMDPMDASFGYTLSYSPTHESRHDERRTSISEEDILPSYAEESAIPLPGYTRHAPEPVTLAMFLFKFGFLFPPFWIFGMFILLSPLREPSSISDASTSTPTWMPEKTESERQQIIATIRSVEIKWAKRCLIAFSIFAVLAIAGGLGAWAILHHS